MNDLPTYSKTLHPSDFALLEPEIGFLRDLHRRLHHLVDIGHECRFWEYALALRAAMSDTRGRRCTLLDVGGGGGLFSPAAAVCGFEVTEIDPKDFSEQVDKQARVIGKRIEFIRSIDDEIRYKKKYNVVTCISVIEHIEDHYGFLRRLISLVAYNGLLILTTDFHPSGEAKVDGHLRTYSEEVLTDFARRADQCIFFGGTPEWSYIGEHVHNYNFASLVIRKLT